MCRGRLDGQKGDQPWAIRGERGERADRGERAHLEESVLISNTRRGLAVGERPDEIRGEHAELQLEHLEHPSTSARAGAARKAEI